MNQLPHSEDAERAVLGAVLVNNFLLAQALAELEPDDFFIPRNRKIFVAMSEIGNEVSEIPLREHLKLSGETVETTYLMNLRHGIPQLANISRYTRIVKQKSALRRIAHLAEAMESQALGNEDAGEILTQSEQVIAEIRKRVGVKGKSFRPVAEVDQEAGREFERLHRGDSSSIPTYYSGLDRVTRGGIQPGDMWVIASLTGRGKSSWALGAARMQAMTGIPVAFVSREMSDYENYVRMLCAASQVPMWKVKPGMYPDTFQALTEWRQPVSELPIFMNSSTANIFELRPLVRDLVRTQGIKSLFIDYLQLMSVNLETKNNTRAQEVATVSRVLKEIAMENQIGVFALAQFNRGGAHNEHPELHHLAESSGIEKDASLVLILDMPQAEELQTNRPCKMRIAKHRNGPLLSLDYLYRGDVLTFEEAA